MLSRRWRDSHARAVIGKEQQSLLLAEIREDLKFCGLNNTHALPVLRHHMEWSYFFFILHGHRVALSDVDVS